MTGPTPHPGERTQNIDYYNLPTPGEFVRIVGLVTTTYLQRGETMVIRWTDWWAPQVERNYIDIMGTVVEPSATEYFPTVNAVWEMIEQGAKTMPGEKVLGIRATGDELLVRVGTSVQYSREYAVTWPELDRLVDAVAELRDDTAELAGDAVGALEEGTAEIKGQLVSYNGIAVAAALESIKAAEESREAALPDRLGEEELDNKIARSYYKDPLTPDTVLDDLPPGRYPVSSGTVAANLGLPGGGRGVLVMDWLDSSGIYKRATWHTEVNNLYRMYRSIIWNGGWGDWVWESQPWHKGTVSAATSFNDLSPGAYEVRTGQIATTLGLPEGERGNLTVTWLGGGLYRRMDWEIDTTDGYRHYRATAWNGSWGDFQLASPPMGRFTTVENKVTTLEEVVNSGGGGGGGGADESAWALERMAREADMRRRVGRVESEGQAVLALTFDHGTTKFRDFVWPALVERGLAATIALCPETHFNGTDSRDQATVAELRSMADDGLEIANHSGDHKGASGYAELHRQIITAHETLESTLNTNVDSWIQPGYSSAEGGDYDGFGTGLSAARYYDTTAGRMIMRKHPMITGMTENSNKLHPIDGFIPLGITRAGYDTVKDGAVSQIQEAIDTKRRIITFCHPYAIYPDSHTGSFITESEFLTMLDWVAQQRDAGLLKVVTLREWAIAQP